MLIPSAFQKLPSTQGCFNGRLLFGGTVSQMASALAQMTRAKALSEAHYHIGSSVLNSTGGRERLGAIEKSGQDTLNFLHQPTPVASHLALIIQYSSKNFRSATTALIDIELRDTASNSYTGSVIDVGVRFSEIELEGVAQELHIATTGAQLISAPSNPTPEAPRPLYIPSANRGDLLNVVITVDQVKLHTVHIYDLFIPEETP
jgi:hypothetical protein